MRMDKLEYENIEKLKICFVSDKIWFTYDVRKRANKDLEIEHEMQKSSMFPVLRSLLN